jgi:hypothetical protein
MFRNQANYANCRRRQSARSQAAVGSPVWQCGEKKVVDQKTPDATVKILDKERQTLRRPTIPGSGDSVLMAHQDSNDSR